MPKPPVPEEDPKAIEDVLKAHPDGVTLTFIAEALGKKVSRRTLQYRLRYLVDRGRAVAEGQSRAVKYRPAEPSTVVAVTPVEAELLLLSEWSAENLPADERAQFIDVAQDEILALYEGNFARHKLRPSEFDASRKIWNQGR